VFLVLASSCAGPQGSSDAASPRRAEAKTRPPSAPSQNAEHLRGYWVLYQKDDPGWPEAKRLWLTLGQPDSWLLVENLLREMIISADHGDAARSARARTELGKIADVSVPYLVEALNQGDNVTKRHCADVLVSIGKPAAAPLAAGLSGLEPEGRREAAAALGRIGDPAAIPALVEVSRGDPEWKVRAAASESLGVFASSAPAAEESLARSVSSDPDPFVRRKAAEALARGSGRAGAEALAAALRDGEGAVRAAAATSLGERRDPSSVSPLVAALEKELASDEGDGAARKALTSALRATTGVDYGFDVARWKRYEAERPREGGSR
jgi:HEAT repeat protein